jgi:hypothetical protein
MISALLSMRSHWIRSFSYGTIINRVRLSMSSDDLLALGFVRDGNCSLDPMLKSGVRFSILGLREDRVIYAFTVDTKVKYIGVCDNTATCFSNRMGRYQSLAGAGTN